MVLEQLVAFSNLYGSNEELVLAGGGNTSAKDGDIMYIKGSGTQLATITAEGFVKMSRSKINEIFTTEYPDDDKEREALYLSDIMSAKLPGQDNIRPSVETTLHSLFPFTFVLHLHPALVNGITCAVNGEKKAEELFGDDVLWIEPCKPGYILAKVCSEALENYEIKNGKPCEIVLLANHGIFIADNTVEGLEEKLFSVMSKIRGEIEEEPDFQIGDFDDEKCQHIFNEFSRVFGEDSVITYEPSEIGLKYASSEQLFEEIKTPFNPDQIVYCKAYPVYIDSLSEIEGKVAQYKEKNGFLPKIFFVKDCGIYGVDYSPKGSETAVALFNDALKIYTYAKPFGGKRPMTDDFIDFIVNWEAESYRSNKN